MKRCPRLCSLLLTAVIAAACLPAQADEFPAPVTKLDLQDGDTLVFLGDSITHQCLYQKTFFGRCATGSGPCCCCAERGWPVNA